MRRKLPRLARLPKAVLHRDKLHRRRALPREYLGDGAPQPAGRLMLLYRHDRARAARGGHHRAGVERLDGVDIDNLYRYAMLELLGRAKRVIQKRPRGKHRHLRAVLRAPDRLRLAELKRSFCRSHDRRRRAAEPEVGGPRMRRDGKRRFARLFAIARRNDYHVGQYARERDILERLVRCAVGPDAQPRVAAGDFDRHVIERDGGADLLVVAPGAKGRVRGDKGNLAVVGQARRDRGEVLLGHAKLDIPPGILFFKRQYARTLGQVGAQHHHLRVTLAQL